MAINLYTLAVFPSLGGGVANNTKTTKTMGISLRSSSNDEGQLFKSFSSCLTGGTMSNLKTLACCMGMPGCLSHTEVYKRGNSRSDLQIKVQVCIYHK